MTINIQWKILGYTWTCSLTAIPGWLQDGGDTLTKGGVYSYYKECVADNKMALNFCACYIVYVIFIQLAKRKSASLILRLSHSGMWINIKIGKMVRPFLHK